MTEPAAAQSYIGRGLPRVYDASPLRGTPIFGDEAAAQGVGGALPAARFYVRDHAFRDAGAWVTRRSKASANAARVPSWASS
jgi:hypothetical protein